MQNRRGIVYPRIAEEIVDYAELQEVLGVSYLTAYRIMHGHAFPNHKRKKALSDYLGIPVDELWVKDSSVEVRAYRVVHTDSDKEQNATPTDNSEII